jgi:hypothetical protein
MAILLQILVYWLVPITLMVWILLKEGLLPSSPFAIHWLVNPLMSIVVTSVANFMDSRCYPSSLHICLLLLAGAPQPLETWYHIPWYFAFVLSFVCPMDMEMTSMVYQHSTYMLILMLALHMVILSFSSSS